MLAKGMEMTLISEITNLSETQLLELKTGNRSNEVKTVPAQVRKLCNRKCRSAVPRGFNLATQFIKELTCLISYPLSPLAGGFEEHEGVFHFVLCTFFCLQAKPGFPTTDFEIL